MSQASAGAERLTNEPHALDSEVRAALELMPQLVWTTTAQGYHDYYNERWYAFTGMPRPGDPTASAEGWNWKTYLHPDDFERTITLWAECLRTGAPYEIEYRFREAATGAYRWFLARALPMFDASGAIRRWFGTCTDIHEQVLTAQRLAATRGELELTNDRLREQAAALESQTDELQVMTEELIERTAVAEASQEAAEEERARARGILEGTADAYFLLDAEFRFVDVNPAMERGGRIPRQELLGRFVWDVFPAVKGSEVERHYRQVAATQVEAHFTHDYSDGRLELVADIDAYPTPLGGVAIFWRDVTERERANAERARLLAELSAERERLHSLILHLPAPIALLAGPAHRHEIVNDAYRRVSGGGRDVTGLTLVEAFPELAGQGLFELFDQVYETGEPWAGRETLVRYDRDGTGIADHWFDIRLQPVRDETGQVTAILDFAADVTAQVRARHDVERLLGETERVRATLAEANRQLVEQQLELELTNQQLQDNAVELEAQTEELHVTVETLAERTADAEASTSRARFSGDVGRAITAGETLAAMMQRCCQSAVDHLRAAFCRVWVLDADDPVLVLTASAGLYTHLDGGHSRVPVGQFKIGQIAAERRPHVTNAVRGDPRVPEQAWAEREGMVAFAGYPLVIGDEMVGVFAMFSRQALSDAEVAAFETGATAMSIAVSNARLFASERRARVVAEEANQSKSEFLAMMSHELRTPLNAIGGYAELLQLGIRGAVTPAQLEDLERIRRSQRHLLGLINGVLTYAKVDAGAVEYTVEAVPMDEVLATCEALLAPLVRAKNLAFHFTDCDSRLVARADGEKVQQIVINLLSNAVKFTDVGGTVILTCKSAEGGPVAVSVSDTGCGIDANHLERVFQPFVQIDAKLTRTQEGTGLGLSISRELARGMGGDILAESALGEGSTFTLLLPAY